MKTMMRSVLRAPEDPPISPGGPTPPAPGSPPAPVVPPIVPPDPDPETIRLSQDALNKRLDRAGRAKLVEVFGTDDPVKIQAIKDAAADAEKRRQADMTEVQRATELAATEKKRADDLGVQLATERFSNTVTRACATLGVKNLDYAAFEVQRAMKALKPGEELNVETHLKGMLALPTAAAALGIEQPVTSQTVPVTTTPVVGQPPTPPPAGGGPPKVKTAMDMTPAEFAAHTAALS